MSDQILSQEEIDALMSAMDSGEVDLEEETKPEPEVVAPLSKGYSNTGSCLLQFQGQGDKINRLKRRI